MATTTLTQRRDGWYCEIKTNRTSRVLGPFPTKIEAGRAAKVRTRPEPTPAQSAQGRNARRPEVHPFIDHNELINRYRPLFNRIDATELELAEAVKEMTQAGISQSTMAQKLGGRKQTWFSWMYRLSLIPESLKKYLRYDQISTTALVKGVDQMGVDEMIRIIPMILDEYRESGVIARISERELYDYRLSLIPESLKKYMKNDQIGVTVLIKGVDQLGVDEMLRLIPSVLAKHRRIGKTARITERELYE